MNRGFDKTAGWLLAAVALVLTSLAIAQPAPRRAAAPAAGASASAAASAEPSAGSVAIATVAANVCVPEERTREFLACPPAATRFGRCGTTAPPAAAANTPEDRGTGKQGRKQAPTLQVDEATARRQANLQRRSVDLLQREVQLTATLVRNMNRTDPNRPNALMRLAENLQELASVQNGSAQELEEPIFQARGNEARQGELRRQQQALQTAAQNTRRQLITVFEQLVADHPQFPRMDAVLFYLAFAYQDSRDQTNARRIYLVLIQRFPDSQYVPNAYLSFAEFFFDQGSMEEAQQFYNQVIRRDTPENTVRGYAMYKLSWTYFNLQRFEDSLNTFYAVIDYARAHPDVASNGPLARSARQELVTAYGSVYGAGTPVGRPLRPGETLTAFRRYAENEDGAFMMLEKLGELYQDNGQWANSVAVYRHLISERSTSDRVCIWQGQIAKATVASGRQDSQMTELQRMLDLFDTYRNPPAGRTVSTEARNNCRDAAARIVFDVASHWHLQAVGRSAEGQQQTRGTRDNSTMARAAQLYGLLVERFPDLDEVTFPDYRREDWPTRYRIAFYQAEILRDQGNFEQCGAAYDRVVEMNPGGEFTEDAAYKAVLCYNDQFSAQLANQARQRPTRVTQQAQAQQQPATGRGRPNAAQQQAEENARLRPREFNAMESGMSRAFTRYICFAGNVADAGRAPATQPQRPAAGSNVPQAEQRNCGRPQAGAGGGEEDPRTTLLTIRYRRAYLHYAANHFEEASTMMREIAMSDPATPDPENLREIAADLYFDSLVVMGQRWEPNRPACFETMVSSLPSVKERFCDGAARAQHTEFCGRVDLLRCQALRRNAEALHTARRFYEAGRAYVDIVRNNRECLALPGFAVDEILYNAAIDFDAANMLGRSMRVRQVLVDRFLPRNSRWAVRALYRLAGNYHAIQVFSRAADFYEQYADYVSEHRAEATAAEPEAVNQAADALRQATLFRIGLGEEQRALDNAQKFARYFGNDPGRRRQAAAVIFSIGRIYQDRAERLARQPGTAAERAARQDQIRAAWREVVRHYTSFVNRYARQGTLDQQIQGNVALGRGYWNLEDQNNAQLYFRAAVGAWGEPPPAPPGGGERPPTRGETTIREQLGDEAPAAVESSKDAVAEARFFLAETVYRRFQARRLPLYRGAGTRRAYDQWAQHTLTPFINEQRRYLQEDASQQYQQVISMHVPNWEIAAASRLADMFYTFAQYIRTAEPPPDVRRVPDLLDAYNVMRDEFTQSFVDVAKAGFTGCITRATQVHWFNEWSQRCERSLNEIDRRQFPLADEIRVEPNLVFTRAANARPVYQLGGAEDEDSASEGGDPSQQQGGAAAPSATPSAAPSGAPQR